jgi:hypothetical protein
MQATTAMRPGPGVVAYCRIATRTPQLNPSLKGTSLVELTVEDYRHEGEFVNRYLTIDGADSVEDDPISGHYIMGFALAIGSLPSLVGKSNGPDGRVVQIHCDWYSKLGLWFTLNRNIIEGDEEKYPFFAREREGRMLQRGEVPGYPFMTRPGNSVSLIIRRPFGNDVAWGHRWGLGLAEDGNRLFWVLDGRVMDVADIAGFFRSSPGCVADGAFVTIAGGGSHRRNTWMIEDVRGRTSADT